MTLRKMLFLGLVFLGLVACKPQTYMADPTPSGSPTFLLSPTLPLGPTLTQTSLPSLNPTFAPTSAVTGTPAEIKTSLPDVAFSTGSDAIDCQDLRVQSQIFISRFPYSTAVILATSTNKTSYFGPLWSRDGNWIAYAAVKNKTPMTEVTPDGQMLLNYQESDSLWLAHPDGSNPHQIANNVSRQELITFHNSGPHCDVIGGLWGPEGWSPDSQWLTFRVTTGQGQDIYTVNIQSGITQKLSSNVGQTRWAPENNRIALVVYPVRFGAKWQVRIAQVEAASSQSTIFLPPSTIEDDSAWNIAWSGDETSLYVATQSPRSARPPVHIWRLDLATAAWQQIGEVTSGMGTVQLNDPKLGLILCDDDFAGFQNATLEMARNPTFIFAADCPNMGYLQDGEGQALISYTKVYGRDLWVVANSGGQPRRTISLDALNLSSGSYLSGYTWKP